MNADEWAIDKLLERRGQTRAEFEAASGYKVSEMKPEDRHGLMRQLDKELKKDDRRRRREAKKPFTK